MAVLTWDGTGERKFQYGVKKGVLYLLDTSTGTYPKGVAWNGLITVSESPEGADSNDFYADDIKYGSIRGAEDYNGSIEAYTHPDEFHECDGSVEIAPGVLATQQKRKRFGLSWVDTVGDDTDPEAGYVLHIVYNATVSPTEKSHETANDSIDAETLSWDFETVPIPFPAGAKPSSHIMIDSTNSRVKAANLKALEDILYGTDDIEARLPLPAEVVEIMSRS